MRHWIISLVLSLFATVCLAQPDAARKNELRHLLKHDCGSCHGLTLRGGLGPALLPKNLVGKPAGFILQTILDGRPGTAMPPWRPLLSEPDAQWLVQQLLTGEGTQ